MAHRLIEADINLVMAAIQSQIAAAIAEVSVDRALDPIQTPMPLPKEYFNYDTAQGYRPPAIFVVGDSSEFLKAENTNFVKMRNRVNVTVVIESQKAPILQFMAYRYQAALHKLLDQTNLQSADGRVNITVLITRASFSATYTNAQQKGNMQGVFRKEVLLECEIEHSEKLS